MGVRVCLYSPHSSTFISVSPPPPQLGVRLFLFSPLFIFIYSYLFGSRSLSPLLPPSLPPSGSLISPRSGASAAPPLARRDVARGDVDADVSCALDVCVQPGPWLQGRRRPLRRLLEQQQPQVRQWGAESRGYPGLGALRKERRRRRSARIGRQRRALSESASLGRGWLSRRPRETLTSCLSLLRCGREPERPWASPGLPRPDASAKPGETRKRREPGSGDFASHPGRLASIPSQARGLGTGSPGCKPPGAPSWSVAAQGLWREPAKHPQSVCLFVCFLFKFFPSLFPGALRKRTGWGKCGGLGSGSFRFIFSSLTARKSSDH